MFSEKLTGRSGAGVNEEGREERRDKRCLVSWETTEIWELRFSRPNRE